MKGIFSKHTTFLESVFNVLEFQIFSLQSRICKSFSQSLEQFFLTLGQNNFSKQNTYVPLGTVRKLREHDFAGFLTD